MRPSTLAGPMLAAVFAVLCLGTFDVANAAGYDETDLVIGCDPMEPPSKCDPAGQNADRQEWHHAPSQVL